MGEIGERLAEIVEASEGFRTGDYLGRLQIDEGRLRLLRDATRDALRRSHTSLREREEVGGALFLLLGRGFGELDGPFTPSAAAAALGAPALAALYPFEADELLRAGALRWGQGLLEGGAARSRLEATLFYHSPRSWSPAVGAMPAAVDHWGSLPRLARAGVIDICDWLDAHSGGFVSSRRDIRALADRRAQLACAHRLSLFSQVSRHLPDGDEALGRRLDAPRGAALGEIRELLSR